MLCDRRLSRFCTREHEENSKHLLLKVVEPALGPAPENLRLGEA
jgi:hypothetical protein